MKLDGNNAMASASSYSLHFSTCTESGVIIGMLGWVGSGDGVTIIDVKVDVGIGVAKISVGVSTSVGTATG
jgi:hypothetical protein